VQADYQMLEDNEINPTLVTSDSPIPTTVSAQAYDQPPGEAEEDKLLQLLEVLSAETVGLSEQLVRERHLITDLCSILHEILINLNTEIEIPIDRVAKLNSASRIKVDKETNLQVYWSNGKQDSKPLQSYPTDVVLDVLWAMSPALSKIIKASMEEAKRRINLLMKIRERLNLFHEALNESSKESWPPAPEQEGETVWVEEDRV
jgi:hypothetical protein